MDFIVNISSQLSEWMRPYLGEITNSIVITFLAIYGNDINSFVKSKVKSQNIIVRSLVFIAFMTFGYGFLAVLMLPHIRNALNHFGNQYLAPVTILFYLIICILATRKKQI